MGRLYPGVLPDGLNAEAVIRELDLTTLSTAQRDGLAAIDQEHNAEHAAMTQQLMAMVDEVIQLIDFWASRDASREPPQINRHIRDALEERSALNTATESKLTALLGEGGFRQARSKVDRSFGAGAAWYREPPTYMTTQFGGIRVELN